MKKPLVVILMGAIGDAPHCARIEKALAELGLAFETRVGSAHKTPAHVSSLLAEYEADGRPKVYITVAGLSNALSGFADGAVNAPVIACPPPSESHGGADLYSSIRMPGGIAPAFVQDPANAALLAAKILGLCDPEVAAKAAAFRRARAEKTLADDAAIRMSCAGAFDAGAPDATGP